MGRKANVTISNASTLLRNEVLLTADAKNIQRYQKDALLALQCSLELGETWGVIEIPIKWLPPGVCSANGTRVIDIGNLIRIHSSDEASVTLGILTVTRYALLCFLVPVMGSRAGGVLLAPTTISSALKYFCKFVAAALKKPISVNGGLISRLSVDDLRVVCTGKKHLTELNRILQFKHRGYWSDIQKLDYSSTLRSKETDIADVDTKRDENAKDGFSQSMPFLPFSDKFIGESGWRISWIVEHLGPALISCAEGLADIYSSIQLRNGNRHALESKRSYAAIKYLSSYNWANENGDSLSNLPFELTFKTRGQGAQFSWPPKSHVELKGLLVLLQTSHLFIFLLSTGGRISEALSLEPGCIVESKDGTATIKGRTYKLVTVRGGKVRDWPIPSLGVFAICQQERLEKISDFINLNGLLNSTDDDEESSVNDELEIGDLIEKSLWRRVGTGKRILGDYNAMLISAIEMLGLTELSGDVNPHAHRFRKTIARLLALALSDAPKILMDLFGHKTIEMTLHYILTDPLIRAEMQEVLQAQTIMLAEHAIENIDEYGGPAADRVKKAIDEQKVRWGSEFGAKNVRELADILTLSGTYWMLVRPGVICTKLPQQAGPCNKEVGMPETSRCRSNCDFRLEQAAIRDDVNRAIEEAFQSLDQELTEGNDILAEMWLGQVYANLDRFPGLRQQWGSRLAEFEHSSTLRRQS